MSTIRPDPAPRRPYRARSDRVGRANLLGAALLLLGAPSFFAASHWADRSGMGAQALVIAGALGYPLLLAIGIMALYVWVSGEHDAGRIGRALGWGLMVAFLALLFSFLNWGLTDPLL
jgi:ABC-type multidrug transport system fused ATPase/permease subunit